ncbi:MAG: hypothetical protein ACYTDT_09995 [Planctomycetota bacterium]|jgi:hypothetical protein
MKYFLLCLTLVLFSSVAFAQEYTLTFEWDLYGDPPDSPSNPMNDWQLVLDGTSGSVVIKKYVETSTTYEVTTLTEDDGGNWDIQHDKTVTLGNSATVVSSTSYGDLNVTMTTYIDTSGGDVAVDVEVEFELDEEEFGVDWGIDYDQFTYTGSGSEPSTINPYLSVWIPQGYDPDDPDFREWLSETDWWVE